MNRFTHQNMKNFPPDLEGVSRRRFIENFVGAGAAAAFLPGELLRSRRAACDSLRSKALALSENELGDEIFWGLVKNQFMLRKELIMLNAANLCPSPFPVQHAVFEWTRDMDRDPSSFNRSKFAKFRERARFALAKYLRVDPDEIALTRNTSEGNNTVIAGLTFRSGDEVVIWDENHPTANIAWDVRAQRYGFKVKRVRVPYRVNQAADLIQPFADAITERTRMLCFSHLSNLTGVALPAQAICRMARERGVLSHVDGAQTFGSQVVDLHALGCDFFTGSSHKWFMGPREVGILYVRKERIPQLWPAVVGVGYSDELKSTAKKFETLGQRDDARICAMDETVAFHESLGSQRIEKRIVFLATFLKRRLQEQVPNIHFYTPLSPDFSGGVVVFTAPGIDLEKALKVLYWEFNIGGAVFGGDLAGIRLCPHIYNTVEEMHRAVAAVAALAQ
jgi:isopenicillin-N epimerase